MKKFLVLVAVLAGVAVFAHYKHALDLPYARILPRENLAQGAEPWRVPYLADLLARYAGAPEQTGQASAAGSRGRGGGRRTPPAPVVAALARQAAVPVTATSVGTARALNTVVVRPQVEGRLVEVTFREGQDVKEGDVLARIDPATYRAQYDQAVAKKAQDEAELANARIDLDRYERLARTNFGSRQQADTQRAKVAQLSAQIKVDQALIDNAKAVLDRTVIRAPISGRTGLRSIDVGNIVRASDPQGLVTITQLRPISVFFNLPQQRLQAINAALERGTVKIDALAADNVTIIESGIVEVVDNQVDTMTGTVKIKARFDNAGLRIWPGQFVNIRVFLDFIPNAVVVPTAAVQRGPEGAFVYVIDAESKAQLRQVRTGLLDENQAVIVSGLKAGEKVVVTGFSRLSGGEAVRVQMQTDNRPVPQRGSAAQPPAGRG